MMFHSQKIRRWKSVWAFILPQPPRLWQAKRTEEGFARTGIDTSFPRARGQLRSRPALASIANDAASLNIKAHVSDRQPRLIAESAAAFQESPAITKVSPP